MLLKARINDRRQSSHFIIMGNKLSPMTLCNEVILKGDSITESISCKECKIKYKRLIK